MLHNLFPALVTIAPRGGESFSDLVQQTGIGTYRGLTGPIAEFVLYILIGVYLLLGSFGLGIILTAVVVRLLLLNLTIAQIRMMKVNQYLQPLTKRVQQRYKGDKQAQNKRLMELYAKFKMNPLAGCLGMFIQIPIFFGIYRALYDPIFLGHSFFGVQLLFPMNLYFVRSLGGVTDLTKLIFDYIDQHNLASYLWQWWALPGNQEHGWRIEWGAWPLGHTPDLATATQWGIQQGDKVYEWALYWPALLLVVLYILSSFWMQRVMKRVSEPDPELKVILEAADKGKKNPGEKKAPDLGEQMQRNMRFMTIFLVLIAFILSTGALLYFFMQNLLMIIEYTLIPRTLKLSFSAADVQEALESIDKGRSLTGEEKPAEEVAQAPLRGPQSRGFKKKR